MTNSDLKFRFHTLVREKGGYKSHHAHFDKANLITPERLELSMRDMQEKWRLYRSLKEGYTEKDLEKRMASCIYNLAAQGCRNMRTFIDADSIVGMLPMNVAALMREKNKKFDVNIELATQPLEGVFGDSAKIFEQCCEVADVIGGLPSRDRDIGDVKHVQRILSIGKEMNKPVDVHVDQENNPAEKETEMLARETIKAGMEGKVRAVHSISLAAHDKAYQHYVADLLKDAGITVIVCPSAAISMKPLDVVAPIHNSIAPIRLLAEHDVPLALGIDNIKDLFMPICDGDLWFECRLLMEATRCYDLEFISDIATLPLNK